MDVILEILRWTSLVAIGVVGLALVFAPFVAWIYDYGLRWLWAYFAVMPLAIGCIFGITGLAHTYWPNDTGNAAHCGEGTQYVEYEHTTYVLSGKVLVPVTTTDWQCIAAR